jgi:redox-sensitive bicupin YhaK (pirin superfamily)
MTTQRKDAKKVIEIRQAPPMHWVGDGFPVRSMFTYDDPAAALSPFLLLDYAAPAQFSPTAGDPRGVGEHPHRGFETVTIVYDGEVEHRDSAGHAGKIGPGDVQWMTAASGIVHEEKHGRDFSRRGGMMEMVQLWVNLPADLKMSTPGYQDVLDSKIMKVQLPGGAGSARVIAGEFRGAKGPARTFTPINLWDLRLDAGYSTELGIADGHNTALLVLGGGVRVNGSTAVGKGELALLARHGDEISIESERHSKVLVLSGEPIDEPVVGYGPFVMNTEAEIRQALRDYQLGKMGHLSA